MPRPFRCRRTEQLPVRCQILIVKDGNIQRRQVFFIDPLCQFDEI